MGNCSEIFYKREDYELHTSHCSHEKQKSSGLVGTAAKNLSSKKLKPRSTPLKFTPFRRTRIITTCMSIWCGECSVQFVVISFLFSFFFCNKIFLFTWACGYLL